ncbi:zinc-ribbon domain containing protein [Cellvibrio mixtus]|uniref:zinc-ribbon domain containing protein n=1 Tax=Cellvibrio mixtus TaxID=39650 RepID=UPI001269B5D5|nr:zinc-ribbon domain containing protein [Cellvibrio mixtus]
MESILIDRARWSKSSQRSQGSHYSSNAMYYENISYLCVMCKNKSIFSAEDQKFSYEVKKQFIWRIPTLCHNCHENLTRLLSKEREFQKLWNVNREEMKLNVSFLKDWLNTIKEIHAHGKTTNYTMVAGILKLLRAT